jgi:hypothetical protein
LINGGSADLGEGGGQRWLIFSLLVFLNQAGSPETHHGVLHDVFGVGLGPCLLASKKQKA